MSADSNTVSWLTIKRLAMSLLAALTLAATGCRTLHHRPVQLRFHVTSDANQNRPFGLDLVAVGDKKLSSELSKVTGPEWFSRRDQYRSDHPQARDIEVWSWEWIPGQVVPEKVIDARRAHTWFLFANYAGAGDHRLRVDAGTPATVLLGEKAIRIEQATAHGKAPKIKGAVKGKK